jgi:hypothetical protein
LRRHPARSSFFGRGRRHPDVNVTTPCGLIKGTVVLGSVLEQIPVTDRAELVLTLAPGGT